MIYHRIEMVRMTFQELAADEAKRVEFRNALNEYGKGDWELVQLQEVNQELLVFLKKKT